MKIAMITSGFLPIPATKGGAVENLLVNILDENEKKKIIDFVVFSVSDKQAVEISKKYKKTSFKFIKIGKLIEKLDKIVFWIAKNILKKKNSHSYRYIFQRLSFLRKASRLLKNESYDKIILENHPTQYLALKWNRNYLKYEGKYYYHCHNEFVGTFNCDEIIKNSKKIICVSKYIAKKMETYLNMPTSQFEVLRNCIDRTKFSKNLSNDEEMIIRKKYHINEKDKILLFTGRIVPEKGVKELITSLQKVKYENYKLLIVGSSLNALKAKTDYEQEIEDLIKKLGDKVIFTGYISYSEIHKYYAISNIAVLPSIWDDPAPLTIIEALVSGVPVITTNSGGIPEYAIDGSAIIIERDKDLIENLALKIDELLKDENELKKMSIRGKEVSKDLTISNYYNNFIKFLEE